tara:strand:- start:161700 stop:162716 length:1017 start_codon:yes stop_codon:yes gene_type:complete
MREIVFAIQQIGPYHHARFQALAKEMQVLIIETRPNDTTYSWETEFPNAIYKRVTYSKNIGTLKQYLLSKTVFICGWYDKEMLNILLAATLVKAKRILISDSRAADAERIWWKEIVKSLVLKFYHGALVAGKESEVYLRQLNFLKPVGKPWDVVDEKLWKPAIGITKENYWVFPARLVEKKNHAFFLSAFAQAIEKVENPPKLFLCGDGPLQLELEILVDELDIGHLVEFKGFVHTSEMIPLMQLAQWMVLPSIYDQWGLVVNEALAAETPVLISDNCGAKELIVKGENGYVFNDHNLLEILTKLMDRKHTFMGQPIKVPSGFRLEDFVGACKNLTLS